MNQWGPSEHDSAKFREGFDRLLAAENSHERLRDCLDSAKMPWRAGLTFSELEPIAENELHLSDWLALTLLDLDTPPAAFRGIQLDPDRKQSIECQLSLVPNTALVDATDSHLDRLNEAWQLVRFADPEAQRKWRMGPTRTSKLLARKKPALVPIQDSRIERWYDWPKSIWAPMRQALGMTHQATGGRYYDALDQHLRRDELTRRVTVLRAIDIAAWELGG